jgi:hypothetical protein
VKGGRGGWLQGGLLRGTDFGNAGLLRGLRLRGGAARARCSVPSGCLCQGPCCVGETMLTWWWKWGCNKGMTYGSTLAPAHGEVYSMS